MKLDRQRIAVLFLIVAVLVRILLPFALLVFSGLPIPTGMLWTFFTATIAGTLPGALPYLVLLLVSFAVRSRATVWGGGITLVLVEILARIPLRSAEPSLYSMLFVAPASAVFVLPVGLLLGAAVGRLFHATEEPSGGGPKSASAQMAANGAALGGAAIILTTTLTSTLQPVNILFAVWALLPYGILIVAGRVVPNAWAVGGAGAAALTAEGAIRAGVFLFPRGSTAAVALLFSPAFISLAALPSGALVGWLVGYAWRRGGVVVRVGASVMSAALLALLAISLAQPDLTPQAIFRRRATLGRIGEPRVVEGSATLETVRISETPSWYQTGDFDGIPGDEIAIIDSNGAKLLDPVHFREEGRIDFSPDLRRRWNWFSALARLDGRLVVVQTGGGFSETEIFELDGTLLWRYRPDPKLSPNALKAADLDGDGRLEFYAIGPHAVVRLDGNGREVWSKPAHVSSSLLLSEPRTGATPAWVAVHEYNRGITIWDENGLPLGRLSEEAVVGTATIADWLDRRLFVGGSSTLRCVDLEGRAVIDQPLGDFQFRQALAVRLVPGTSSHLAVLAGTPRDVKRWRLLVLSADGAIAYDEIFDYPAGILKARQPDGAETLLVTGNGLSAIRPRQGSGRVPNQGESGT